LGIEAWGDSLAGMARQRMRRYISEFLHDEDGAITADWVVLTALIVTMSLIVIMTIRNQMTGDFSVVLQRAVEQTAL
jgi:Flp pilus assembly pilin Flp